MKRDQQQNRGTDHTKMHHEHGAILIGMEEHDHHRMMIQDFRKRFWISTLITIPILLFSPMIQDFFGYKLLLPGNSYFLFALSSIVYFLGGWPFLKGFLNEIKKNRAWHDDTHIYGYQCSLCL
ncbi:hypothetical protein [Asinibacterium sp. OR53]|uniref:hypothetical protein n=1 Tax=Asinibacterium sp. OR53 TaxID=925409 RepID=UPI0018DDF499|nr:hypothetical protein [Asinibacterium sp. OR53]